MYVTVQKIYGKSKVYGYAKEVVTTTINLGTTTRYGWRYSEERFERENYSYKIVVKESYREGEKVKQRQVVMGTFHWFDFIDRYVYGDEFFDEKLINMFPDRQEEIDAIYNEIDKKIKIIEKDESDKWHSSKEFKVHNKHLNLIRKYESKKATFDELYGEDIFEQIYDIHLNVLNQDLYKQLSQIRKQKEKTDKEKQEYERRRHEEEQKQWDNFYRQYTNSSHSIGLSSNYTDEEKGYLKKFYKVLAMKFHPDVTDGDNEPMKFLNKLKDSWGI